MNAITTSARACATDTGPIISYAPERLRGGGGGRGVGPGLCGVVTAAVKFVFVCWCGAPHSTHRVYTCSMFSTHSHTHTPHVEYLLLLLIEISSHNTADDGDVGDLALGQNRSVREEGIRYRWCGDVKVKAIYLWNLCAREI